VLVFRPLTRADRQYDEWLTQADLGLRLLESGRATEAVAAFERTLAIEQDMRPGELADPDATLGRAKRYFNYGIALRRAGRGAESLPQWWLAATLDPQNPRYLRTLSDALRLTGQVRQADSLLDAAGSRVGGDAEVLLSRAMAAARAGRLDEAGTQFEGAVAADSRLYAAWDGLVRVRVLQGQVDAAAKVLDRASASSLPADVENVYRGLLAAARGDTAETGRSLRRSDGVQLDPTLEYVKDWTTDLMTKRVRGAGAPR
jgi:tetratricopeptide (TPR) repeat protein